MQAPVYSVRGQILNVGCNEQNYCIADLGLIIKDIVPTARVVTQPNKDNRNYRVRFDKICNMLNFQPRYTVRDGIREIIHAFATGQITDYRDPRYSNYSFLRLKGELRRIWVEDEVGLDGVRLSGNEAKMFADVVLAVAESQSWELMACLHNGLLQASLGDVDALRNTLKV